jgi:hypothetical protein
MKKILMSTAAALLLLGSIAHAETKDPSHAEWLAQDHAKQRN